MYKRTLKEEYDLIKRISEEGCDFASFKGCAVYCLINKERFLKRYCNEFSNQEKDKAKLWLKQYSIFVMLEILKI